MRFEDVTPGATLYLPVARLQGGRTIVLGRRYVEITVHAVNRQKRQIRASFGGNPPRWWTAGAALVWRAKKPGGKSRFLGNKTE